MKLALRAGVKNATLKQSKGKGASGSFRLGKSMIYITGHFWLDTLKHGSNNTKCFFKIIA